MVNPDGAEYDLTGSPFRSWRKNRQPNAGLVVDRHGRQPELRLPLGLLWRVVVIASRRSTYHGPSAFSTPEARAVRDFIASRRIGGRQQIRTAITFHTAGEQILWPYGYTKTDVPGRHDAEDHAALVALGKHMARPRSAIPPCSRAACTSPTATRSTGRTAIQHIFMYTFELYPSHSKVSSDARFYPPDEEIGPQTERNKAAILT